MQAPRKVQIFIPCFIDQLYPQTAFSMVKVLEKGGCEVLYPPNQTCCGQPAYNAGYLADARQVCKKWLHDFEGTDYIVCPSASCTGFIRNYYQRFFADGSDYHQLKSVTSRLYEFTEFLTNVLGCDEWGAVLNAVAVYHDSCAGLRECKIKEEPRRLLGKVQGLQLHEMADTDTCCGFGGTFAIKYEAISAAMADQKINHALAAGAEYIISTDTSCLMHIDGCIRNKGLSLKTMHVADVLASGW